MNRTYKDSSLNFLKNYNSKMTDLMQSANSLRGSNSSGAANAKKLGSSDNSVLSAKERFGSGYGQKLSVNVSQVAKAQMNQSAGVNAKAKDRKSVG